VLVWDVEAAIANGATAERGGELVHTLVLHKGAVQAVGFSPCGHFVATVGGPDDNSLVVWSADTGDAVCGSPAGTHAALVLQWLHGRSDTLLTAGHYHVRRWEFDVARRRLTPTDVALGSLKRVFTCLALDDTDSLAWCGTASGDVLEVSVPHARFVRASKNRFTQGVASAAYVPGGAREHDAVIVGNGDGTLVRLSTHALEVDAAVELLGGVTSVALNRTRTALVAGTADGNRYALSVAEFKPSLVGTAHASPIFDVVFPRDTPELFVTASKTDVRLWNAHSRTELLRIQVPTLSCLAVAVTPDGAAIITGWDDGKIRAFTPETGRLKYIISDAHAEAVTALAVTSDSARIVSGGKDGRVRVWNVAGRTQVMEMGFKEHKKTVTALTLTHHDEECISASEDGSCIVWNLKRGVRANALFASTMFRAAVYHPDESQILTTGSDRKLSYWDAVDCSPIRVVDGATAEICALDVEADGLCFASGGLDRLVKVWLYDEGINTHVGAGHSGGISRLRISPDQKRIVSVGLEGGVFVWSMPHVGGAAAGHK
jgi:WD40 repeat protein